MKRLILLVAAVLGLAACEYTMSEGGPVPPGCCVRGDVLNVRMSPTGDPYSRCANMGGYIVWIAPDLVCRDVDF
jgi:hypothetical protein